jgi:hypothetical protein
MAEEWAYGMGQDQPNIERYEIYKVKHRKPITKKEVHGKRRTRK